MRNAPGKPQAAERFRNNRVGGITKVVRERHRRILREPQDFGFVPGEGLMQVFGVRFRDAPAFAPSPDISPYLVAWGRYP